MAQILIRDLDPRHVERLKQRARQHGRSLQGEAKAILETAAATLSKEEAWAVAAEWRRRLAGAMTTDSADLLREDRER
jgi:antitoxin FitA